ncbi:MAG: GntR family transcriptional regulator [Advenella sp.]
MNNQFTPSSTLRTLPIQISDQISERIIDGSFESGERLREVELAESFGVSRATIREALRLLEQRGLVQIKPQRGAHVTQLSLKELEDLFEVRASLLSSASRLAAERIHPDSARALNSYLARLEENTADSARYSAISGEMVTLIAAISENEILAHYISDFAQRIGRYVRMGLQSEERRQASLRTWVRLVDFIVQGDGPNAAEEHRRLALENRDGALKALQEGQKMSSLAGDET